MEIISPLGQKVYETVFKDEIKVNVEKFTRGLYTIKLCDVDGNCSTEKLIIE